jgi:hypothetical protein
MSIAVTGHGTIRVTDKYIEVVSEQTRAFVSEDDHSAVSVRLKPRFTHSGTIRGITMFSCSGRFTINGMTITQGPGGVVNVGGAEITSRASTDVPRSDEEEIGDAVDTSRYTRRSNRKIGRVDASTHAEADVDSSALTASDAVTMTARSHAKIRIDNKGNAIRGRLDVRADSHGRFKGENVKVANATLCASGHAKISGVHVIGRASITGTGFGKVLVTATSDAAVHRSSSGFGKTEVLIQ